MTVIGGAARTEIVTNDRTVEPNTSKAAGWGLAPWSSGDFSHAAAGVLTKGDGVFNNLCAYPYTAAGYLDLSFPVVSLARLRIVRSEASDRGTFSDTYGGLAVGQKLDRSHGVSTYFTLDNNTAVLRGSSIFDGGPVGTGSATDGTVGNAPAYNADFDFWIRTEFRPAELIVRWRGWIDGAAEPATWPWSVNTTSGFFAGEGYPAAFAVGQVSAGLGQRCYLRAMSISGTWTHEESQAGGMVRTLSIR